MRFFLFIALLAAIGCDSPNQSRRSDEAENGKRYNTVEIDSCQYVEYDAGIFDQRVYAITHKGNCKYCMARKNQNK